MANVSPPKIEATARTKAKSVRATQWIARGLTAKDVGFGLSVLLPSGQSQPHERSQAVRWTARKASICSNLPPRNTAPRRKDAMSLDWTSATIALGAENLRWLRFALAHRSAATIESRHPNWLPNMLRRRLAPWPLESFAPNRQEIRRFPLIPMPTPILRCGFRLKYRKPRERLGWHRWAVLRFRQSSKLRRWLPARAKSEVQGETWNISTIVPL
jgi:hypothetical protein